MLNSHINMAQEAPELNNLDWFKISNYEDLKKLTMRELFNELAFRVRLYININSKEDEVFYPSDEWLGILASQPIVTEKLSLDSLMNYIPPPTFNHQCCSPNSGIMLASPFDIQLQANYLLKFRSSFPA